jgi:hypothetical protein
MWADFKYEFINGQKIVPLYRYMLLNFGLMILALIWLIKYIRSKELGKYWFYIVIGIPMLVLVTLFNSWFYGLIPIFGKNNIWINYTLYSIIGIVLTTSTYKELKKPIENK